LERHPDTETPDETRAQRDAPRAHAEVRGSTRRELRRRHSRKPDALGVILGGVGELLITAGVFLGLFVVWQLWWTDLQARQYTGNVITEMALPAAPQDSIGDSDKRTDPAPVAPPPPPGVPDGAFAILHIPTLGADYQVPIAEGVSLDGVLHKGLAGHYPDTARAGEVGNFALAGHRQSHGAIFLHIDQLTPGDPIIVQTTDTWYVYRVTEAPSVILPTEVGVIAPNPMSPGAPPEVPMLTLTTCHPLWSTAERLIVHSELDYWAPLDSGTPPEITELAQTTEAAAPSEAIQPTQPTENQEA
ncbi:MAG: class E sortase, partial [bacterium]|nr:class E sortase [bacterium]